MENGSVSTLKFVICFHFQVMPAIYDYPVHNILQVCYSASRQESKFFELLFFEVK